MKDLHFLPAAPIDVAALDSFCERNGWQFYALLPQVGRGSFARAYRTDADTMLSFVRDAYVGVEYFIVAGERQRPVVDAVAGRFGAKSFSELWSPAESGDLSLALKNLLGADLLESAAALRIIDQALSHPDPATRCTALRCVGRAGLSAFADRAERMAAHDPEPRVRSEAAPVAHALKAGGDPAAALDPVLSHVRKFVPAEQVGPEFGRVAEQSQLTLYAHWPEPELKIVRTAYVLPDGSMQLWHVELQHAILAGQVALIEVKAINEPVLARFERLAADAFSITQPESLLAGAKAAVDWGQYAIALCRFMLTGPKYAAESSRAVEIGLIHPDPAVREAVLVCAIAVGWRELRAILERVIDRDPEDQLAALAEKVFQTLSATEWRREELQLSSERYLARARQRLATGLAAGAIADCERALLAAGGRLDPELPMIMAEGYETLGLFARAAVVLRRAVQAGLETATVHTRLAHASYESGDLPGALDAAERALTLDAAEPVALRIRAAVRATKRDYAGATSDLDLAIASTPEDPLLYVDRSLARDAQGQPQKALDDINRAIELGFSNANAYSARAALEAKLGRLNEAIEDFEHALKLAEPNWHARDRVQEQIETLRGELS